MLLDTFSEIFIPIAFILLFVIFFGFLANW